MKKFYRKHFLGCELFFSIALTLIGIYVIHSYIDINKVTDYLYGIRNTFYGTLASLAGTFLGFVITGLSVLLMSKSNESIDKLKKSQHYGTIFDIFFSTSKYLSILLSVSLISLILDRDTNPSVGLFFITVWAFLIVIFRIMRCLWVLEKMIKLHVKNSK